jgi:GNAT superfamily N-acetyltransferase
MRKLTRPARSPTTPHRGFAFRCRQLPTTLSPRGGVSSSRTRRTGRATVNHGAMNEILQVRRADADDLPVILDMINEAAAWLRTKETDQWAEPWPTEAARDARVRRGLRGGDTWIVEQYGRPIATVTSRQHGNQTLWTYREQLEPAVYVSRLIVTRRAAGRGIGAGLIDWAAQRAVRDWSAQWVRIDVWTTNEALHNYYEERGFRFCRISPFSKETYPSAALFQRPTSELKVAAAARFTESPLIVSGRTTMRPDQLQPAAATPVGAAR